MLMIERVGMYALKQVLGVFLALGVVFFIAGCASSSAPAGRGDMVTESDQTDARQRASKRLELALAYYRDGKAIFALDNIKQALATDPTYVDAYNMRGIIYMELRDAALAEDSFRKALSLNSTDGDVLHNYGWLLCQESRYSEAQQMFGNALGNPRYAGRSKTLMSQGLCQVKAGQSTAAEASFLRSYELDPANPVTGYNLANLMYQRGEFVRAQFYARRINNSDYATAQSLWLGIKVERKLEKREAVAQLATQLKKRFSDSVEFAAFERGAFDE